MLSVIIPTLNEENNIQTCINSVKVLEPEEIIVVDAGSTDRTVELARSSGVRVIESQKGRGIQLKIGASNARGDILMFIHADTRFPFKAGAERDLVFSIFNEVFNGRYAGGFFRLRFDGNSPSLRIVELFANLRAKLFSLPYGDQAIFIKKDVYEKIGGFKEYPFLEDLDIVLRLKKGGQRLKYTNIPVIVSSRRLKRGYPLSPVLVSLRNVIIAMVFILGIKPSKLLKVYNL